ncbi:MAG: S8 family serine peptidase [Promethearchaeota archaeon]
MPDKGEEIRFIVSFEDISKRETFLSKQKDLKILKKFDFIPSINLYLTSQKVKDLEKNNLIRTIEEDQKLYPCIFDVLEILELNNYRKSHISYTGKNVNIGIIDNGINKRFEAISDIILNEFYLTKRKVQEITHGTIMATIIGNQYRDNEGIFLGIAPNAKIIDFNISNSDNEYYFSSVLEILDLIISQNIEIDIIFIPFTTINSSDGTDILSLACDSLVNKNIIIVCPAGNFGPNDHTIGSPGAAKKVITIGSLTKDLSVSNFSGRGPTLDDRSKPDFCLPGTKILIPLSNELNVKVSGTSVSAAIGVGIIALIKEFNPNTSYSDVLEILKKATIDLDDDKTSQGNGIINIVNLFKNLGLFQEKIIPYNNLIKKSFKITIGFILFFVILYYFVYFFRVE